MTAQKPSPDDATAFRPPEETPTVVSSDAAERAMQFTPGTILGERYRIVSLVGRGGMGDVYRADDLKLGQAVALKFLARHGETQRLYEEVRIGRQVTHPNVCRLYDVAEVDGRLFITMEFVDGEDLASLLRRVGRLSAEKALAVSRDICAGLAAAHDKGVIHRDLKPANVMVDGRGRARVTDFGLALAAGSASDTAGTPAYMAPEQLAGEGASVKSDIYALGLVLYEVFTGRRPFEATSTPNLLVKQRAADFTRPSLVTRDVPPAVERMILRCLDPNPEARPASVEAIAHELPGGDRLQAAVDAGETPSPEMVAAAEQRGDLPVAYAWPMLGIVILGAVAVVFLARQAMLYNLVPLPKPPAALVERAKELIEKFGRGVGAADHAYTFAARNEVLSAIAASDHSSNRWHKLRSLDAPAIVFWYRQSAKRLVPFNLWTPVTADDPPFTEAGMTDVTLDPRGRLIEFRAVPPRIEQPRKDKTVDWRTFVSESGVDPATLQATIPIRASPVDTDAKFAWMGRRGEQPVRIEGGSYHGQPVWFTVMSAREATATPALLGPHSLLAAPEGPVASLVLVGFLTAAGLTAHRNVRQGRGDRKGAFRIATVLFFTILLALSLRDRAPLTRLSQTIAFALFHAVAIWLVYLALEPNVRRRWPRLLIGWTRLVSGRWRDPMVGRDLLIGAAAGFLWVNLRHIMLVAPKWFGSAPLIPEHSYLSAVSDPRNAAFLLFLALSLSIFAFLTALFLLLILRAFFRRDSIALATMLLIGTAAGVVSNENLPVQIAFSFLCEVIILAVFWRFGLLAGVAAGFVGLSLLYAPLTLDISSWYFGRSLLVLGTATGIALFGFFTSLGGKRWLPELAVDG